MSKIRNKILQKSLREGSGCHVGTALTVAEAARALNISAPTLKELCARGTLSSFQTPGGHLRIPSEAIESFRGPRQVARIPVQPSGVLQNRRERIEQLNLEAQELRAKRELTKLQREDDQEQTILEQRAAAAESARTERERQVSLERDEAARRHKLEQERQEWENEWLLSSTNSFPSDLPEDIRRKAALAVRRVLRELGPGELDSTVSSLIQETTEQTLLPWRRTRDVELSVQSAMAALPPLLRSNVGQPLTEWELRVEAEARNAIGRLDPTTSLTEVRSAAAKTTRLVVKQYEDIRAERDHRELIEFALAFLDEERSKKEARAALERLPIGCGLPQIVQTRDAVAAPIREQLRILADAKRKEVKAAVDADRLLWHATEYVESLVRRGRKVLGFYERIQVVQKVSTQLRPQLIQSVLRNEIVEDEVRELIEEAVDRVL